MGDLSLDGRRRHERGCAKVVLTAGMAMVMPAGFIHLVATTSDAVVIGCNFVHKDHVPRVIAAFRQGEKNAPADTVLRGLDGLALSALLMRRCFRSDRQDRMPIDDATLLQLLEFAEPDPGKIVGPAAGWRRTISGLQPYVSAMMHIVYSDV